MRYRKGALTSATAMVYDTPVHIRFKQVESARTKDGTLQMTILVKKRMYAVTSYKSPLIKMNGRPHEMLLDALSSLENYFTCGQC